MISYEHKSIIVQTVCSLLIPFIMVFALYVLVHGHYGPGGGFQGGVLFGVAIILQRLYLGREAAIKRFPPVVAVVFAAIGLLIYGLAGAIPVFMGGDFLDYGSLPLFWMHGAELRSTGILIIETGVFMGVFGTMVLLFDNLIGERW